MNGRKIPRKVDNFFDNILIDIVEKINPYFKKANFTPNMITTLSLIFGIIMNAAYNKNFYNLSAFSLLLSYFFDCMDGNYARQYDMQTKFGDYYDHIKDWLVIILFLFLFIKKKISLKFKISGLLLIIMILLGTYVHVGCTEKYIKSKKNNVISSDSLGKIIYCPDIKYLELSKYFGCGTFNLALILIIVLHNYM